MSFTYLQFYNDKIIDEVSIEFKNVMANGKIEQENLDKKIKFTREVLRENNVLPEVKEEVAELKPIFAKIEVDSSNKKLSEPIINKPSWIDSMVVAESNINVLKYAISKHIKEKPIEKTDSAKLVENLRNMMQDYYSKKYPTPVHNFGDGSPGIPIGDILNIFSTDTLDVERIKKNLKIGKYDEN